MVFPGELTAPSGKTHKLVATGIRRMSILKFQLYMIGLYVEDRALAPLRALDPKSASAASRLLVDGDYEWSLRVAPLRNGSLSHLRDALVRRLKQMDGSQGGEIASFSGILPNIPMPLGSVFLMSYWRGKGISATKDGQALGVTPSAFVRKGLLGIYTDPAATTVPEV
jgi:hypothetical protein